MPSGGLKSFPEYSDAPSESLKPFPEFPRLVRISEIISGVSDVPSESLKPFPEYSDASSESLTRHPILPYKENTYINFNNF